MTKSPSQLDAEIAEALKHGQKTGFNALITKIENAVDAHPELTRQRPGKRGFEEAELTFSGGEWTARCGCRNKLSKGRGSRLMDSVLARGDTPEEAVDKLVEMIPFWAEGMK